jgi:hypothetical protein
MGLGGVAFSVGWFALIFCSGLRRASDLENKLRAPRKISAFQSFCGHEKAANQAA